MGGWYFVTKVIRGVPYRYRQTSWREGGKVRTKCRCLGRADATGADKRRLATVATAADAAPALDRTLGAEHEAATQRSSAPPEAVEGDNASPASARWS